MTFRFNYIKNFSKAIIIVIAFSGCFQHYYKGSVKAVENQSQKASVIDSLKKQQKYFILRNGSQAYYMGDISVSADNKTIKTTLSALPDDHMMYLNKAREGVMRYKESNRHDIKVLSEAHVYIAPDSSITNGNYVLQTDNIQKIELIHKNKARTIKSYLLGFGLIAGSLVLFEAILASSLSFGSPW
jgi:hypothetical protein